MTGSEAAGPVRPAVGYVAMALTVAVWAGFALSMRGISSSRLQPADVALIRFGVPTLLLLPLLPGRWSTIVRAPLGAAASLLLGAGVPFFFATAGGGALTSAAAVGTLVPGLVPAFTALSRRGGPGSVTAPKKGATTVVLVVLGVLVMVVPQIAAGHRAVLLGAVLLVGASGLWALYTTGLAGTDLDAVACALLLCAPSTVVVAVLIATRAVPSGLTHAGFGDLLPFLLVQGIGVGFLAALTYPVAVRSLGARRAALLGTVSPVLVAVLAIPLLGEQPSAGTCAGIALVTAGVLIAQVRRPRNRAGSEEAARA